MDLVLGAPGESECSYIFSRRCGHYPPPGTRQRICGCAGCSLSSSLHFLSSTLHFTGLSSPTYAVYGGSAGSVGGTGGWATGIGMGTGGWAAGIGIGIMPGIGI